MTVAAEIVRFDPPVFESVSARLRLVPTGTLPRFMLEGTPRYPGPISVPDRTAVARPE